MSEVKLTAEPRNEFGKGAARRLRRAHKIPAVLYGHGNDPVHVALPGHATMLALKHSNTLLTLDFGAGKSELALPKDVQRNPVRDEIEHVDLLLVRRGERVNVDVPLHVVGDSAPGTLVQSELNTLEIEVLATAIPGSIEVSVEGAEAGTQILAAEIVLPEGATLLTDPEALVVNVTSQSTAAADEDEASAETTEAAAEA